MLSRVQDRRRVWLGIVVRDTKRCLHLGVVARIETVETRKNAARKTAKRVRENKCVESVTIFAANFNKPRWKLIADELFETQSRNVSARLIGNDLLRGLICD